MWFVLVSLALQSREATRRGPGRWNPDCGFASQPGNPGPGGSTSLWQACLCPQGRPHFVQGQSLQRQAQDPAQAGSGQAKHADLMAHLPSGSGPHSRFPPESAFRPTSLILWAGRGQDRTQLVCCPQDSEQREELLPRVVGAASCAWIPQRPDAPRPGLRPPGPTTVCRPPADLRHPPQGSERPREGPEATPSLH